jgi:Zn-dependent protease with chaperone function
MHLSVYLPFLFSGLFGISAPHLARRLPPAVATWLLSLGGLLAAGGSAASLALLGLTLVGQSPSLADDGHWSQAALRHADPVAAPVAVLASVILVLLTARSVKCATQRLIALRAAYRLAAALPVGGGGLVVVDDTDHHAFAVPGRPGRIVVSRGLLRSMDAAQRRALLAHERAHLSHRHYMHHAIAGLAAAANPLLLKLPDAIALSTERWADECAAATGTRVTVARALILAASASGRTIALPAGVLAATATQLTERVRAMWSPAPRLTLWRVALLTALLVAIAAAVVEAAHDTDRLFDLAGAAYRATHR